MKRTFALVVLLVSLGALIKLAAHSRLSAIGRGPAAHSDHSGRAANPSASAAPSNASNSARPAWLARYDTASPQERALAARLAERFGRNAEAIERTDGLDGLKLLDALDLEAVFLYENRPNEFRRLRQVLGTDAAADVLLHWREYFGLKRAEDAERSTLIAEIEALAASQLRAAAACPAALPLVLAEPRGVTELIEHTANAPADRADALAILSLISLDQGAADLRSALRTLNDRRAIALEAYRLRGMEGFALVSIYGDVLEAIGGPVPLEQSLILARVGSDYLNELAQTHQAETIADHFRRVAAAGLMEQACGGPEALRLIVEQGELGERALRRAGPDAAQVVFGDFEGATLRRQATGALAEHGAMALWVLDKYANDPDFQSVLEAHGAAIVPPIAAADSGPETIARLQNKPRRTLKEAVALSALFAAGENGQLVIRTIKNDGLERALELNPTRSSLQLQQFLPLYDVVHLGNVLRRGHAPTSGEMTWALLDGCFVVADVLSLTAMQPEGAAAVELARSNVRQAARGGALVAGRAAAEPFGESAAESLARRSAGVAAGRLARWWTVREAGGVYPLLRRLPEALPKMELGQIAALARPLCARAGLRVSEWRPVRFLRDGAEVVLKIPPRRGLKYLSVQMAQAGVGAIGFQKMEEHLASRRPGASNVP